MQTGDRRATRYGGLTRRALIGAVPLTMMAPAVVAQAAGIRLRKLNCFEMRVTDVDASVRFYQGLFGMPVQARPTGRLCLRIGDGPQFMAIRAVERDESPAITHIGYSVEDYDPGRLFTALGRVGFERIGAPAQTEPGSANPLKMWLRRRDGGDEFYFADARGLIVQLSDPTYCGAPDGCGPVAAAAAGRLDLSELNHFTVFVSDGAEANRFYQQTFGLEVQAYQGPQAPVTGIGDGHQFVMYAGGGGRGGPASVPARIDHGCFNMHDFDVDRVLAILTDYGLTARGDARTGPLMHYVSLRMPARGGAEGGTPELYFSDPDGILLQLQDTSYCGGGGYLGNECLSG